MYNVGIFVSDSFSKLVLCENKQSHNHKTGKVERVWSKVSSRVQLYKANKFLCHDHWLISTWKNMTCECLSSAKSEQTKFELRSWKSICSTDLIIYICLSFQNCTLNDEHQPKPNGQYVTLENIKIAIEKEISFWDIVKAILWILCASTLQSYE